MANNQDSMNKKESDDSILSEVRKKLETIQKELNSLKCLNHDADIIQINRQLLIEKLDKINKNLKAINAESINTDFASVSEAYNPLEITSNVIKGSMTNSRATIQMRFYTKKITKNLDYIKNISKEILNINTEINYLKTNKSAFSGSKEEKDHRIQGLEQEQTKLKEELLNFVITTMDHNIEYQELAALLEAENNAMENEIRSLIDKIEELKEQNRSLVHENNRLIKMHDELKLRQTSIFSASHTSMDSFTEKELAEYEKRFLSLDSDSLATISEGSRKWDARVDTFLSDNKKEAIYKKLEEDHYAMTINQAKLKNLKTVFKIKGPGLLNLHTKIDPRVYVVPRGHARVPTK